MKTAGEVMTSLMDHFEALRTERIQTMLAKVGGDEPDRLRAWLQANGLEFIFKIIPESMTTTDYASAFGLDDMNLRSIRRRLGQCEQCPTHGGGCDIPEENDETRGKWVRWVDGEKAVKFVNCDRWAEHLIRRRLNNWGVPRGQCGFAFETYEVKTDDQKHARAECEQYAKQFRPGQADSLFLFGPTGTGKTHLATAIVRRIRERDAKRQAAAAAESAIVKPQLAHAQFWYVPDLIQKLDYREDYETRKQLIERLTTTDLLILDDVGSMKIGEFERDILATLISVRHAEARAIIFTSNLMISDLTLGDRAISRMKGMQILEVFGPDGRE